MVKQNFKFWFVIISNIFIMNFLSSLGYGEQLMIDRFDKPANLLGGRANVYQRNPSRAMAVRISQEHHGPTGKALMIKYDKKGQGGPHGNGGWCGYYTLLKKSERYFDATKYKVISFWVKGAQGGENFKVGLADRHWDRIGDSIKSEDIGVYLKAGKITTEWQKAEIPLDVFFLDNRELSSISICFENECFTDGAGRGTIFVDDIALE